VLTVVAKLFGIVGPDHAVFGEKDYQQLVLIQRMVTDLRLGVRVVGLPTVRDVDGLAMSSRNVHLDSAARAAAVALPTALSAGARAGARGPEAVLAAAHEVLSAQPALVLDYLALRDPQLGPAPQRGEARLLVAATVGGTRLIDNVCVQLGGQ
jgi:pantoate--beta-alanine ligase